jgi:hypothetical protein
VKKKRKEKKKEKEEKLVRKYDISVGKNITQYAIKHIRPNKCLHRKDP